MIEKSKPKLLKIHVHDSIKTRELLGLRKIGKTTDKYKRGDKPPGINYTQKLIEYADIDYEAAKILFNIQDRDYDFMNQAACLCAQAAEKYLKGFLFWNAPQSYKKFHSLSHDLKKILNECVRDNNEFQKFNKQIEELDKFSLLKYPDEEDKLVFSDTGLDISSGVLLTNVKEIGDFVKRLVN